MLHDGRNLHLFPGSQAYWWWGLLPLVKAETMWFDQHWQTSDHVSWELKPLTQHHGVNGGAEMIDERITKIGAHYERTKHESSFYQHSALDVDQRNWQVTTSTIPGQPGQKTGVRDCDVFQHDGWYYLVGANHWTEGEGKAFQKGKNTRYFLHKSRDLKTWQVAGNGTFWDTGSNMTTECPSVNIVDGRCVMLGCQNLIGDDHYAVGDFKDERFHLKHSGQTDVGNDSAAHSWMTQDDKGRWILTTWLRGSNMGGQIDMLTGLKPRFQSGWHTIYSLPRHVTVTADDHLRFEPLSDLQKLRQEPQTLTETSITKTTPLSAKPSAHFEIDATWSVASGVTSGIRIQQGGEHIDILHSPEEGGTLTIDSSAAKHALVALDKVISRPLPRKPGEPLHLRVFFDGCLLEVYGDDGQVTTARWYAADPSQITSHLVTGNGSTPVKAIHHYPMRSVWSRYLEAASKTSNP
jgi:sucrose-6-phosphate hydrolase SacC (GH32 family)